MPHRYSFGTDSEFDRLHTHAKLALQETVTVPYLTVIVTQASDVGTSIANVRSNTAVAVNDELSHEALLQQVQVKCFIFCFPR